MNKCIEDVTLKIVQRMEKNRHEYNEARGSFNDTGNYRYQKKMDALDIEYDELKEFMLIREPKETVQEILESDRLRRILLNVKSKVEYMEYDFPINSHLIGIKELLKDI